MLQLDPSLSTRCDWTTLLDETTAMSVKHLLHLSNSLDIHEIRIEGRPLDATKQLGKPSIFFGYDDTYVGVEALALQYYQNEGQWLGFHCEGMLLRTFFGLLMYDCLFFKEVKDVFITPFQDAPLDLSTEIFYEQRRTFIDTRLSFLKYLSSVELYEEIVYSVHRTYGFTIRGVVWSILQLFRQSEKTDETSFLSLMHSFAALCDMDITLLERKEKPSEDGSSLPSPRLPFDGKLKVDACTTSQVRRDLSYYESSAFYAHFLGFIGVSIGSAVLSDCLKLLCVNYVYWQSGLPDLFLIRRIPSSASFSAEKHTTAKREHCLTNLESLFVEVKGPRDHLSEKQRWWLAEIKNSGGAVEVCRVKEEMLDALKKKKAIRE
ncbi:VRR-NUC domain-containing protein [Cardiosporidium cionae]|uniref:Fanconi-associated nuclease n=1 Tax=Cardiosporidium cionae TaxID=476202 RepID=A0ABQ7J9I9_9APIC|nr:VRR-NUC domain-containing protein [Cardiosporidium cionae]|eukprot:KAF8820659.1 VRR-NUC domain-containing protein [Cardiosporidium cionae]